MSENAEKLNIAVAKSRIWEIDFIRGFCVFLMILDHLTLFIDMVFGPLWYSGAYPAFVKWCGYWFFDSEVRKGLHAFVLFLFFAVSGISGSFSRNNMRRSLIVACAATAYSLLSLLLADVTGYQMQVLFGTLQFYTVCIFTYAVIDLVARKIFRKKSRRDWQNGFLSSNSERLAKKRNIFKIAVCSALFVLCACVYLFVDATMGTPKFFGIFLPDTSITGENINNFYSPMFSPGDFVPIIPHILFFLFGAIVGPLLYPKRRSLLPALDKKWHVPFTFTGRYAVFFYFGHMVALPILLYLFGGLFLGKWAIPF
jgi:hypothetical protein